MRCVPAIALYGPYVPHGALLLCATQGLAAAASKDIEYIYSSFYNFSKNNTTKMSHVNIKNTFFMQILILEFKFQYFKLKRFDHYI